MNDSLCFFLLVYRASFRQTFEEFTAPTGIWKWAIGWTLITLSGLVLAYDGWRRVCMDFHYRIYFFGFIEIESFFLRL